MAALAATTTALASTTTATAKERKRLRNKKYKADNKAKKLAASTGRNTTTVPGLINQSHDLQPANEVNNRAIDRTNDNEVNNRADDRTNVAAAEAVAGPEEAEAVTVPAAVTQPIDRLS